MSQANHVQHNVATRKCLIFLKISKFIRHEPNYTYQYYLIKEFRTILINSGKGFKTDFCNLGLGLVFLNVFNSFIISCE